MERLLGLSDFGIFPLIGCAIVVCLIVKAFSGKGGGNNSNGNSSSSSSSSSSDSNNTTAS